MASVKFGVAHVRVILNLEVLHSAEQEGMTEQNVIAQKGIHHRDTERTEQSVTKSDSGI